jgi:TatA/E family protein of Tat protein translocase
MFARYSNKQVRSPIWKAGGPIEDHMAWDDPVVWVLIIAAVIFLFGSNKIPEIARSLGAAKKEFDQARQGFMGAINSELNPVTSPASRSSVVTRPATPPGLAKPAAQNFTNQAPQVTDDPLLVAARNEGIDTRGKTKTEIATELATKLKDQQQPEPQN